MPYVTRGLATVLLEIASDRDPKSVKVALVTQPAGELDGSGLAPDQPVFTEFYFPDTAGSVDAVFGMDLGTPDSDGRFISHPDGQFDVLITDDFHSVVFVAVPPYDRDSLAAFDRSGTELPLTVLDIEPEETPFEG
ncbi:MAG: hypothetical protein U5K28_03145 [Halobacteriales archaeon]|nr:hypothetical protein [Halobacteriales archaeon]